jgi:subtilisin family serine protease
MKRRTRHVILELSHNEQRQSFSMSPPKGKVPASEMDEITPKIDTLAYDASFPAVALPKMYHRAHPPGNYYDTMASLAFDTRPDHATYLVRGKVEEDAVDEFEEEVRSRADVVGVYADLPIEPMSVCPGSAPVGTDEKVASLLGASRMHKHGMDGKGVLVAIVDSGVNLAYLKKQGKDPNFDKGRSWAWDPETVTPGKAPVGHGTMCAFDVCIAAPQCTLLDIALLHSMKAEPGSSLMEALLSDAILAYRHLLNVMNAPRRPGEHRSLVVNNSWGMFHPEWDWPVGHPSNYSDNPNHPFSRIVATLERAGADILFAAGNCGANCPDGRCQDATDRPIYGANSSVAVLCVAGVDTNKQRVGYSAIGPGRLENHKPDICGYTHFRGSGVYTADGGTSAACPVVAGVVAALRSKRPYNPDDAQTSPAAIRSLVTGTAKDLGPTGYDYQYGHGVVDGNAIANKVLDVEKPWEQLCGRYPWVCDSRWWRWIMRLLPQPGGAFAPSPSADVSMALADEMQIEDVQRAVAEVVSAAEDEDLSAEQMAYRVGYWLGQQEAQTAAQGQESQETIKGERS